MTADTLTSLFKTNHGAIRLNVDGITDEEALLQPKPDGNCLNWVVGHVVASRNGALTLLGEEPVWSREETDRYKRGSAPIRAAGEGKPLAHLLADFDRSQERLLRGLSKLTEAKLDEPFPNWGTVRQALFFLHFHEAYHAGQTAMLRRLAGKPGAIQ
jgi:uncharacterized damage-inducible protein DinB